MSPKERTFTASTPEQAAQYASARGHSYPMPLYQALLDYHSGGRKTLLDVGTGPGKVIFDLLPHFNIGIGCDASAGMIEQARKVAEERGLARRATFVAVPGEDCFEALDDHDVGKVDMITAAMAVHWMDVPRFYTAAAKALRPGGTLAMWTANSLYCQPSSPNAAAAQAILSDLDDNMLRPYLTAGSMLSRQAYATLPLPWNSPGLETSFDESSFTRHDWDAGGVPSAPNNADGSAGPFLKQVDTSLIDLGKALASSSAVIRWREAHPKEALTDKDAIRMTAKRLQELPGGHESLVLGPRFVLLLTRKL